MYPFSPTLNPPSATIRLASAPSATLLAATTAESVATSSATGTPRTPCLWTRTPTSTPAPPFLRVPAHTASSNMSRLGSRSTPVHTLPRQLLPPTAAPKLRVVLPHHLHLLVCPLGRGISFLGLRLPMLPRLPKSQPAFPATGTGALFKLCSSLCLSGLRTSDFCFCFG